MKKRFVCILTVLIVMMFIYACQPTPEEPPVVSKNDGTLEGAIANGASDDYVYQAPKSYEASESLLDGKMNITIDADTQIKAKDGIKYPVYEATIKDFDSETVKHIASVFFGDAQMEAHISQEARETKSYILNELILPRKEKLADLENGYYDKYFFKDENGEIYTLNDDGDKVYSDSSKSLDEQFADEIDSLKTVIEMLEERLKTAPESVTTTPASLDGYEAGDTVNVDIPLSNGRVGRFCVKDTILTATYNYEESGYTSEDEDYGGVMNLIDHFVEFEGDMFKDYHDTFSDTITHYQMDPALDYERAISEASDFIKQLGLNDYSFATVGVYPYTKVENGNRIDVTYTKYGVVFMRTVGDSICIPDSAIASGEALGENYDETGENLLYSEPFSYERVIIWVGKGGVESLYWSSPLNIERELNASAQLVDFEKAAKSAMDAISRDKIHVRNVINNQDLLIHENIHFERFELGYAMMKEKNKTDCYLLVPAWITTHIDDELEYTDDTKTDTCSIVSNDPSTIYVVNALDGSVIDRALGY